MFRRTNLDLQVVALLALLAVALTWLPAAGLAPVAAVQGALAALLVLCLPGYALVSAAFPRHELRVPERILLSLSASAALAALGGLALNVTVWSLTGGTWRVLLAGLTLLAVLIAAQRRAATGQSATPSTEQVFAPARAQSVAQPRAVAWRDGAMMAAAVLLVGLALGLGGVGAPEPQTGNFTQLWAVPDQQQGQRGLRVGIQSREQAPETFMIEVVSGMQTVQRWNDVTITPGQEWQASIGLPADVTAGRAQAPVEVLLYRQDNPNLVYRRVRIAPETQSLP